MFEQQRATRAQQVCRVLRILCAAASLCFAALPAKAEPSVAIVPLGFHVEAFRGPDAYLSKVLPTSDLIGRDKPAGVDRFVTVWGPGGGAALFLQNGAVKTLAWPPSDAMPPLAEAPRGALPGSRMQTAGPLTAYLSEPRTDYAHGALGDAIEAGHLMISERQPLTGHQMSARPVPVKTDQVGAGPDAVFEDREPRLADLDGDGTPEILVVKSYRDKGSALAVIGRREGAWTVLAETPPTAEPMRWLNPAAVADFDGDGKTDIALVRTPHRNGMLQLWTWNGGTLTLKHEKAGYSNHAFGSLALDLVATVDLDGDGRPELAIPTLDREWLAILSLGGGIKELQRIPLPARALTGVAALGTGKAAHILVGLEDGRVADVRP
jgi:hypothetical protein